MRYLFVILVLATSVLATESDNKESSPTIFCTTRTMFERPVQGNRCPYNDEVMRGIQSVDPLVIRCARLDVDCRGRVNEPAEE